MHDFIVFRAFLPLHLDSWTSICMFIYLKNLLLHWFHVFETIKAFDSGSWWHLYDNLNGNEWHESGLLLSIKVRTPNMMVCEVRSRQQQKISFDIKNQDITAIKQTLISNLKRVKECLRKIRQNYFETISFKRLRWSLFQSKVAMNQENDSSSNHFKPPDKEAAKRWEKQSCLIFQGDDERKSL
jgi:hypothetical protein